MNIEEVFIFRIIVLFGGCSNVLQLINIIFFIFFWMFFIRFAGNIMFGDKKQDCIYVMDE